MGQPLDAIININRRTSTNPLMIIVSAVPLFVTATPVLSPPLSSSTGKAQRSQVFSLHQPSMQLVIAMRQHDALHASAELPSQAGPFDMVSGLLCTLTCV